MQVGQPSTPRRDDDARRTDSVTAAALAGFAVRAARRAAPSRRRARPGSRPRCRLEARPSRRRRSTPAASSSPVWASTNLALDGGSFDEAMQLGIDRTARRWGQTSASRAQHVEDRIRGAGVGDREPDAHDAGTGLIDEPESCAELLAERVLEGAHQAEQVVLRHRIERIPAAPPQRDGLEQHGIVPAPVGVRVPVHERDVTRRTFPQERVVVQEPGGLLDRVNLGTAHHNRTRAAGAGCRGRGDRSCWHLEDPTAGPIRTGHAGGWPASHGGW